MGYVRGENFPFNFEPNGFPFGSKLTGKLSPRSYPIQCERKWKHSFLSVRKLASLAIIMVLRTGLSQLRIENLLFAILMSGNFFFNNHVSVPTSKPGDAYAGPTGINRNSPGHLPESREAQES